MKALIESGTTNRTALATAVGLSYDRFVTYLDWMTVRGFVRLDEQGRVQLTPEGARVYDDLVQWIVKYVGRLKLSRNRLSRSG